MAENLNEEIVASYSVTILGVKRTKAQLAELDRAVTSLRAARYSPGTTVTAARFGTSRSDKLLNGQKDIFASVMDTLEGNVQGGVEQAMAKAMAQGKRAQAATLRAATTKTGNSGASHSDKGRNGPGRDDTGDMIKRIGTNVETERYPNLTNVTGWHGWGRNPGDPGKIEAQENGTKGRKSGQQPAGINRRVKKRRIDAPPGLGVPAANSIGAAIPIVREQLKRDLGALKK